MQSKDNYNTKRVHKVNITIVISLVVLICIQVVIARGLADSIVPIIAGLSMIALCMINYFIPINDYVKGFLFSLLSATVILALFYVDRYALNKHYMLYVTIAMIALYFKKELIAIFGLFLNIAFIITYLLIPEKFLYSDVGIKEILTIITLMNGAILVLYLLTKWGNELVRKASQKEEEATKVLTKLNETFQTVDEQTSLLDTHIGEFDSRTKKTYEASKNILIAVQQMATAIEEEATNINHINQTMTDSVMGVNNTMDISQGLITKSNDVTLKVEDGWNKMNEISNRMSLINGSVRSTAETVIDLKTSIDTINHLLKGINSVAAQTNLLALNAAIESARAGEQGKGFAVVADQIRKLSEQTQELVVNITEVTQGIFIKSEEAAQKSLEGEKAVSEGTEYINEITDHFTQLKKIFADTNEELNKSMLEINNAMNSFMEIQELITNVASISEENSASTQEILSIIEDENSRISQMNQSIEKVNQLSKKLKSLTKAV